MSPPAEKPRSPAWSMRTACRVASARHWVRAAIIASHMPVVSAPKAGGLKVGGHVGQPELQSLEVLERTAELFAGGEVFLGGLNGQGRAAERAGGDVEAPAIEARHGDAEALALVADAVIDRHAHAI